MATKKEINDLWFCRFWFTCLIVLTCWSAYIYKYNVYMEYKDYPVTFVDKYTRQRCYKGSCHDQYEGLFKTEDGYVFDRPISSYMYRQMHLGEKFPLKLRPLDIRQTSWDNAVWFIMPVFVYVITFVMWLATIVGFITGLWFRFVDRQVK